MSQVIKLDRLTINQIAAGEVIEKPHSVVKELVENAIDAEATSITIEIKEGGFSFIRVTDDGSGIAKEDIKQVFLRHTTSKIRNLEDLQVTTSLGFRGEALASIVAVSRVELITRTADQMTGWRYVVEGHQEKSFEEIGCPIGTTIIIKDLFYNTPARKKFLKSAKTESSYVTDYVQRIALGHRQVGFKYVANQQTKLHTKAGNSLEEAILYVFGKAVASQLIPVNYQTEQVQIDGYVGQPVLSRGNRSYEIYFINGRYIKSKWIGQGIEEAMKGYLMHHQFPFAVLLLTMNPQKIDVNIHPTKMDVRFDNDYLVQQLVCQGIQQSLKQDEPIPEARKSDNKLDYQPLDSKMNPVKKHLPEPFEKKRQADLSNRQNVNQMVKGSDSQEKMAMPPPLSAETRQSAKKKMTTEKNLLIKEKMESYGRSPTVGSQLDLIERRFIDAASLKSHRIIGQLFETYWLVEFEKNLYIIDQHAAHEKVYYERFVEQINQHKIATQQLLTPIIVDLAAKDYQTYEKYQSFFSRLGFEIEPFGPHALQIRGVPYLFNGTIDNSQFMVILDQLDDGLLHKPADVVDHQLATMGCKAAIKGNHRLSKREYQQLIEDLLELKDPYHCPHGRPTMIKMSRYDIEKKIKRII